MLQPILHFLQHGQSNAIGKNAFENSSANSVRSTTALVGALMFRNALAAWQPDSANPTWTEAQKRDHFVQAVEKVMGSDGETGMYGACQTFISLCASENGIIAGPTGFQLIGSVAGQGDRTAAQLSLGTAAWDRVTNDLHYAPIHCAAGDFPTSGPEKYAFGGKIITVAENDQSAQTDPATYKATLQAMSYDIDDAVYAETGVLAVTPAVIYQPASHASNGTVNPEIALALLELALATNEFHMSSPCYHLPHFDSVHLNAYGAFRLGCYAGLALKRVIVDAIDWKPLHVVAHRRDGPWLELDFAGGSLDLYGDAALVVDRSGNTVTNLTGDGFVLRKPDNSVNDFRECKALGKMLRLRYDSSIAAGSILRYAIEGTGIGPASGPRGTIRDNQGNRISVDGYAMHNWCPMFRLTLS